MAEVLGALGAAASIAQLIGIASSTLRYMNEFRTNVSGLPESFEHTKCQMELLMCVLDHISKAADAGYMREEDTTAFLAAVDGCRRQFQLLNNVMRFAFPRAGDSVAMRMFKGVRMAAGYESKLRKITKVIREYIQTIVNYRSLLASMPMSQKEIATWLNPRQCLDVRETVQASQLPRTCQWIFEHKQISSWVDDPQSQILWIWGPPGCGKSFVYSTLIDHLDRTPKPLVYFFFCGGDKRRIEVSSLLRVWCHQMICLCPDLVTKAEVRQFVTDGRKATPRQVVNFFLTLLEHAPTLYLTVDALDECIRTEEFTTLIGRIPRRFKILIVSRDSAKIREGMSVHDKKLISFEFRPEYASRDIEHFISHAITTQPRLHRMEVLDKVRSKFEKEDRLFIWVRLMFEEIKDTTSLSEIDVCLDQMPKELDELYQRIKARIDRQPHRFRLLAYRIFFWVSTAGRFISVPELCGLLAISFTPTTFDERNIRLEPDLMMSYCGSLLQTRDPEQTICQAHFTVTQYLQKLTAKREVLNEMKAYYNVSGLNSNDSLAAAVCLKYLCSKEFGSLCKPYNRTEAFELLQSQEPQLSALAYTVSHWYQHLAKLDIIESNLMALIRQFLNDANPNLETWWHLYWFSNAESQTGAVCPPTSGREVAAYFNLDVVTENLSHDPLASGLTSKNYYSPKSQELRRSFDILNTVQDDEDGLESKAVTWPRVLTSRRLIILFGILCLLFHVCTGSMRFTHNYLICVTKK